MNGRSIQRVKVSEGDTVSADAEMVHTESTGLVNESLIVWQLFPADTIT